MRELIRAEAGDSVKSTIALSTSLATILIVVGVAIALLVVVRKRTGRPRRSSILVFLGIAIACATVQHLSNAQSYDDSTWPIFFVQMIAAITFVTLGYRKSALRTQLKHGENHPVDQALDDSPTQHPPTS